MPPLHRSVLQVAEAFLRHRDNAPRAKDAAARPDAILADSVRIVLRLVFFEHGSALGWWDLPRPLTWADFQHASSAFAASTRRPDSRLPGLGAVPFGHAGEIDRGAFDESDWSSVTASVQAARESTQAVAAGPVLWGIDCGAFYEGLLGYRPRVEQGRFCLDSEREHARRSRGCYFTPAALVDAVLDRSLDPLIEAACCRKEPERALLALRICDPACGSGVFLVAAARRVARSLARLRGGTEDVSDEVHGAAMRDSVGACLYGVDVDPIALELCRIALWLVAGGNRLPLTFLDDRLACADALLGATPLQLEGGIPEAAYRAVGDDDVATSRAWRSEAGGLDPQLVLPGIEAGDDTRGAAAADAWCASFLASKQPGVTRVEAWTRATVGRRFLHWHLRWPRIFPVPRAPEHPTNPVTGWSGGFHLVIGNPPWIAHAGRAAQPIEPHLRNFHDVCDESFAGYKTTHGMFVHLGARLLRPGGRLGMIVPTSLADLEGYRPARRAHDRLCRTEPGLPDFGDVFEGVFQPCMAVISIREQSPSAEAASGDPWDLERRDLTNEGRTLIARLSALPSLPPSLFGERGVQTTPELRQAIREHPGPAAPRELPLREGADIVAWKTGPVRLFGDPEVFGGEGALDKWREVAVLIRQTARFPVASANDGAAFRNSLLAGFEREGWSRAELLVLLNSALIRWLHFHRFRDARQGMPQVKIGHLRSIPSPPAWSEATRRTWREEGSAILQRNTGILPTERARLDLLVFEAFGIEADERRMVSDWAEAQYG